MFGCNVTKRFLFLLENQIVGDAEMKEFKDEYMKDIEFIPARVEH